MEFYEYGPKDASYRLVQPIDSHSLSRMEMEMEVLKKEVGEDFHLTAFVVENWNDDLSPWEASAVFGKQGFGGKAKDTLAAILSEIQTDHTPCYLGGYSLAGLFSLWAGCQTDAFAGIAAASPSLWYPRFLDYLEANSMKADKVYLSLGDREEKTRNPVMATVGDCVRAASEHFQREGLHTTLEWNPGNHFKEPELRTAKAFAWLLQKEHE
jgi:predicted alpha/beta superfamily hydrolase